MIFLDWICRRTIKKCQNHESVEKKLNEADEVLTEHARRLRNLEIEAGLYGKPPLRRVR